MSVYKNCVKMPIILIFDSLSASKCHMVMKNLREYLIAEWKTRHPNDSEEEIDKYVKAFKELCGYCVRVTQQKNFYDCGIFMLQYVESFFQNPIAKYDLPLRLDNWFDEEVTDSKREKIRRIIEDVAQKQKESKQENHSKKD